MKQTQCMLRYTSTIKLYAMKKLKRFTRQLRVRPVVKQAVVKQAIVKQAVGKQAVGKRAVVEQAVVKQAVVKQAVVKQVACSEVYDGVSHNSPCGTTTECGLAGERSDHVLRLPSL